MNHEGTPRQTRDENKPKGKKEWQRQVEGNRLRWFDVAYYIVTLGDQIQCYTKA